MNLLSLGWEKKKRYSVSQVPVAHACNPGYLEGSGGGPELRSPLT
jgi:hypothetical protein